MKKYLFLLVIAAALCTIVQAQKVYQTKSGKIKFFSTTPVEDIEAINNQVDAKLGSNGQMVFMVAIKGFKFDNALMQEHFNGDDYMQSNKFPKAVFMGNIIDLKTVDFSKDGSYKVSVKGNLEIHGVKKEITVPGIIEIKAGKVSSNSVFKVKIADYGVQGHAKVAKEIEVTVDCKYN